MKGVHLTTGLRAIVLAGAAVLFAMPLTLGTGVAAAALGAAVGALAGQAASRSRLRLPSVAVLTLLALLLGVWLARLMITLAWPAALLGPVGALWLSEAVRWLALVAPFAFLLRFTAARHGIGGVVEMVAVAAAMALSLAAHRNGMVHRPHLLGDWAWSRGLDPTLLFLAAGGLGTFILAALLLAEQRLRRLPLHFSALALVVLALFFTIKITGPPPPRAAGDLGLTGDPATEEEGQGQGRGQATEREDGKGSDVGDLEFRDEYRNSGGEAPVAVVVLRDDYTPPAGVYYFRQSAFSQYNGRRLVQATRDDVDRDVLRRFPSEPVEVPDAPPLVSGRMRLPTSVGLLVDHVRPFALDSPASFQPTQNPNPMRFQRAYNAVSHAPITAYVDLLGHEAGDVAWDDAQWRHYTKAPRDPRYRQLADEIVTRLKPDFRGDPLAQALAIKGYLDENGIYSRRSSHAGTDDPAGSFLFGDLTGYCVHFAHAATYLLRSRGVPARVAAGYAVAEGARGEGSAIMLQGNNAHAWPEIYLDEVGWVVVDLAPQQSLDEASPPPDQALQRMLGEMMRQRFEDPEDITEPMAVRQLLRHVARLLLLALLAAMLVSYLVKVYRQLVPLLAGQGQLYRLGYRAALDRLAEVGLRRRFGESRERFAARAVGVAPSFGLLTEQHLRAALGHGATADARQLRQLAAALHNDLGRQVPGWRRVLGAINPFSWLLTR